MALLPRAGRVAPLSLLAVALLLPHAAAAANRGCSALPEWFSGVPDVPTTTPGSPCQFQQWAWQTFLALLTTSPAQPVPRYLTWDFPKPDINALFCASACQGGTAKTVFNLCGGPPTQEVVNATTQPGFPPGGTGLSGEVIDQAGNPVYFTAHVSPDWVGFVTSHQLSDPAMLSGFDAHRPFPAGTFEIKTSWRLAAGMSSAERAQSFITHACVIPEGARKACATDPTVPCAFPADLALLGFHITGGGTNHPELIWATFEHQFTAPDCAETPQPGPWALYDGTADCSFQTSRCNRPNSATTPNTPINVCRKVPHGGAAPDTARQIDQLNRDVQAHLPRSSPLRFYQLVGTLWATNPAPPLPVPGSMPPQTVPTPTLNLTELAGSPLLSNTSLETFKQDVSCFGCHNSQFPGEFAALVGNPQTSPVPFVDKTLYVSHVILFPYFFTKEHNCICPTSGANASGRE